LNHLGWVNQNRFYWYAARLKFKDKSQDIRLPTDEFAAGEQPGKPGGKDDRIYWAAQLVPLGFVVVDSGFIYQGANLYQGAYLNLCSLGIAALAGVVTVAVVVILCVRVPSEIS
jgi:hypothetical protein